MTIRELSGLLARREAALDRQTHRLTLAEALANERVFGEADRAIVRPIGDHKSYRTTRTLLYRYPARPA
jgi:hypothetical protein